MNEFQEFFRAGRDPTMLERDPNPFWATPGKATDNDPKGDHPTNPNGATGQMRLEVSHFTAINAVTGVPDIGQLVVEYNPREFILQDDSFGVYLRSFRLQETTPADAIAAITNDLVDCIQPLSIKIQARYEEREGVVAIPVGAWAHPDVMPKKSKIQTLGPGVH